MQSGRLIIKTRNFSSPDHSDFGFIYLYKIIDDNNLSMLIVYFSLLLWL